MPDISGILDGLTAQQRAAATQRGPVLVIAGAGTGKTKTLAAAIAYRISACGIPPARILAITFTNKAANEMAARIRAALGEETTPDWVGTFHGLGARQLRIEPEVAGLRSGFDILDADDTRRIIKRIMKAMNLAGADESGEVRDPLKLVGSRISKWKDEFITPETAPAAREELIAGANRNRIPIDPPAIRATARIYAEYQRTLRDANAADFGDLLLWPVRAMIRDPAYKTRWAGRFDSVLSDEYQDINRAQYSWLRLLSEQHREIFAVGDDDQSIFGWRGADVQFIRRFTQDFPGGREIRLEENFRSTGHILGAANALIAVDHNRLGETLYTRKPAGAPIEILKFRNDEAQAAAIVTEIVRRRAEGVAWDDIAILYRSNAPSRVLIEEALMRASIPYTLIGDVGFYQRAEIKDALALLRLTTAPGERNTDEAFLRVINTPARGLGEKAIAVLRQEADQRKVSPLRAIDTAPLPPKARTAALVFADAIRSVEKVQPVSVADQLSLALDASGYRKMLRESRAETAEGRLEKFQEFIRLAGKFHSARELLDHAALATGGPDDDAKGMVRLLTLHRAKGLEFGHAFLPGWNSGIFPPPYGDFNEERRLAYVGLTRGMRRVTISYCAFRRGPARPSEFIKDIPEEHHVLGWLDPRTVPHAEVLRTIARLPDVVSRAAG